MEVGKQDAGVAADALFALVAHREDVQQLGVKECVGDCRTSIADLTRAMNSISGWKGGDFASKRSAAEQAMKVFDEHFQKLLDFYSCLKECQNEERENKVKEKREKRTAKDRSKKTFMDGGCSKQLARVLAEFSDGVSSVSESLTSCDNNPEATINSSFVSTRIFSCDDASADSTPLHRQFCDLYDKMKSSVATQVSKGIKKMDEDEGTHAAGPLKAKDFCLNLNPERSADANAGGDQKVMKHHFELFEPLQHLPCLTIQTEASFFISQTSLLLPGCMQFIQTYTGYPLILVVPIEDLLAHGYGLETIPQALESLSFTKNLEKLPLFGLAPKTVLYIPAGHVAVSVTMPSAAKPQKGEEKNTQVSAFASYFTFERDFGVNLSDAVKVEISSHFDKQLVRSYKALSRNQVKIKKWMELWRPAVADEEVPPAALAAPADEGEKTGDEAAKEGDAKTD